MRKLTMSDFRTPTLLLALSAIPMLGGVMRLNTLFPGATTTVEDARFQTEPVPILIHVIAATLYCLLGAFQFSPGFRSRYPNWHRHAGRLLGVCGLLVGLTGIWMTIRYPIPASLQGPLLYCVRIGVGTAMVASIVLGVSSILRHDVARHEAWMIRAYALGQGAGTQAIILLPLILIRGGAIGLTRDLLMLAAWLLNLAVAEWIISRRTRVVGASSVSPRTSLG